MIFGEREYRQRVDRTQKLLGEKGMDALLVTSETNYYYYTGHRHHAPWSTFSRPMLLLIPRTGEPVALVHKFLLADAEQSSWLTNIAGHNNLEGAPVDKFRELVKNIDLANRRIGAELGYEQRLGMSYRDFSAIDESLPEIDFVDAADLLWEILMIKSPAEIEYIKQACKATSEAYRKVWPRVKAGMTEREVEKMLVKEMLKAGAERPGFVIMTSGKGNYERISGRPTDRKLRKGDMVWIDLSARVYDYWSDFSRGGVVGEMSSQQKHFNSAIREVTRAGVEVIKPGITPGDIVAACNKKMTELGFSFTFEAGRLGHGIGLLSTEPPHIADYDDTVLKPGMTATIEPGIVNEHGVFCLEENYAVTEDGCQVMSEADRELYEIS